MTTSQLVVAVLDPRRPDEFEDMPLWLFWLSYISPVALFFFAVQRLFELQLLLLLILSLVAGRYAIAIFFWLLVGFLAILVNIIDALASFRRRAIELPPDMKAGFLVTILYGVRSSPVFEEFGELLIEQREIWRSKRYSNITIAIAKCYLIITWLLSFCSHPLVAMIERLRWRMQLWWWG